MTTKTYTVLADAVVVRTGDKPNEVQRYRAGTKLVMDSDDPRAQALGSTGAISSKDGATRPTIAQVARKVGGLDDPVKVPDAMTIPEAPSAAQIADAL